MKKIPAPIDEKNVSSDWFYDGLGDIPCASIGISNGAFRKCAFYRRGNLWEATWCTTGNSVTFHVMSKSFCRFNLDEFFNYVKEANKDTGDDALIIEYNTERLYSEGVFSMSFYFKIEE